MAEAEDDVFRVYSDRVVDAGVFEWSPYMDLLSVLPSESSNPSFSIFRLINDRQTGSPVLFTEKLPFAGTTASWVPDKHSLAIGDTMGNVFIYDAERQRTVELQRVNEGAVGSLTWCVSEEFACSPSSSSPLSFDCVLAHLPRIYAIPATLQEHFKEGPDAYIDSSPLLSNDSFAASGKFTILSVLGESAGNLQLYFGGSIPIGEVSLPTLFPSLSNGDDVEKSSFIHASVSPSLRCAAAVSITSPNVLSIHLVNTGILRMRAREIGQLAKMESTMRWILQQLNSAIAALVRVSGPPLDELYTLLTDLFQLDEEDLTLVLASMEGGDEKSIPEFVKQILTSRTNSAKLSKLVKSSFQALDFLLTMQLSRVKVLVNHLLLHACELVTMASSRARFGILGLSEEVAARLHASAVQVKQSVDRSIERSTQTSYVLRTVFPWLALALSAPSEDQRPPPTQTDSPKTACDLIRTNLTLLLSNPVETLSLFVTECQSFELEYSSLLSLQRKKIASKFTPIAKLGFENSHSPDFRWAPPLGEETMIESVWVEGVSGELVYGRVDALSGRLERELRFAAPAGSEWKFPKFYRQEHIFLLLKHDSGLFSACLLRVDEKMFLDTSQTLTPVDYGYSSMFVAQALPSSFGGEISGVSVSVQRGLCSLYTKERQRMLTLDLEADDDDEEDEGGDEGEGVEGGTENEISSNGGKSSSVDRVKRGERRSSVVEETVEGLPKQLSFSHT